MPKGRGLRRLIKLMDNNREVMNNNQEASTLALVETPALDNIIVLEQLPIITEKLEALTEIIDARTAKALSMAVTEENVKTAKTDRTALRNEYDALEEKRKAIKNAVLAPYEQFEAVYKRVTAKYIEADKAIKSGIDAAEKEIKARKRAKARIYFEEYARDAGIDFINFDVFMPDVRMSDSDTALKKVIKTYLDKVASELALIREQEYADEIIVEYRKLPDLTTAMRSVQERHRQLDELEKRKAEREAREAAEREARAKVAQAVTRQDAAAPEPEPPEAFTPPVAAAEPAQSDPLMRVAFTVTGRRSALRALKQYILSDGGLKIE